MARVGLEQDSVTNETSESYENEGVGVGTAEGTDSVETVEIGSELDEVISVWNHLSQTTHDAIMEIIRSEKGRA
jgi:hypothetical protein